MYVKKIFLFVFLFLFLIDSQSMAQSDAKGGFKVGIELKDYFSNESSSFKNEPGFTFCVFGKFNLNRFSTSALQLNVELGFTSLTKNNSKTLFINTQDNIILDEKFNLLFFEIAVMPSFNFELFNNLNCEIFVGPFLSYGDKSGSYNILNDKSFDYPYMSSFGESIDFPIGINTGASVYYKRLLLELRYKYSDFDDEGYKIDKNNVFILIGFAF